MTISFEKAEKAQQNLVSVLAKTFNAASSPLHMGLSVDQPWVGIGSDAQRNPFFKVQLVRDLTKEEAALLPQAFDGIAVKYQKSWMGPR